MGSRETDRKPPPMWLIGPSVLGFVVAGAYGLRRLLSLPAVYPFPPALGTALGLGLLAVGLGSIVWGLWTLTLRRAFARDVYRPRDDTRLVTEGPYAYVRNPLYIGVTASLLGWSLVFLSTALALMALLYVPVAAFAIRWEERELEARFGEAYRHYRRRVPRIWPRLR